MQLATFSLQQWKSGIGGKGGKTTNQEDNVEDIRSGNRVVRVAKHTTKGRVVTGTKVFVS